MQTCSNGISTSMPNEMQLLLADLHTQSKIYLDMKEQNEI